MRLKTLGVLLVTVLAAFTMVYWLTDAPRREAVAVEQEEDLAHLGEIIFSNDPAEPAAAGCATCHGADGTGGEPGSQVIGPSLHTRGLADKLRANPNYVRLVVSYGGVVVSGNVNSQMPAWSAEVGGPLNEQQIEAVVTLVEGWAAEAAEQPVEEVPDTEEAGAEVYAAAGCVSCHGAELEGGPAGPNIQTIGSELVTDLEDWVVPSQLEQMQADYDEDPRMFLEKWIRDSATNYNDGASTGMPAHPEGKLSESQLTALITFLLAQTGD
ncbi:MAG TPA: c-type cytochrome [Candidatus Limnocylindria bacterium]|nr:c-type cytochrome [Candidatus Limnocylindria bacterium]